MTTKFPLFAVRNGDYTVSLRREVDLGSQSFTDLGFRHSAVVEVAALLFALREEGFGIVDYGNLLKPIRVRRSEACNPLHVVRTTHDNCRIVLFAIADKGLDQFPSHSH